jgi:hypothetical protein
VNRKAESMVFPSKVLEILKAFFPLMGKTIMKTRKCFGNE